MMNGLAPLGKLLLFIGAILVALGLLLTLAPKIPWLGKLPGDIALTRGNFMFYFPITTSILISVVLSLLLYLLRR